MYVRRVSTTLSLKKLLVVNCNSRQPVDASSSFFMMKQFQAALKNVVARIFGHFLGVASDDP